MTSSHNDPKNLLRQVMAARNYDLEAIEEAQRALLEASPETHQRLLGWLARHEPMSAQLVVGLALLSVHQELALRAFAKGLLQELPIEQLGKVVDYIHGWYVDRTHVKLQRQRFDDEMTEAYAASAGLLQEKLSREGVKLSAQEEFRGGEVLVTTGCYDKVQQVLDHLGFAYKTLPCQAVAGLPLRADQILIVNCPGSFEEEGIAKIRKFVANGGTLITTDWALETTLQRAFPEFCAWNHVSTGDDVVEVSWINPDSPYTQGVEVPNQTISWWLEGSSYPIRVLDERVQVLMRSKEMGERYEEDALVVAFSYGEGMAFHLTSHYYLQRSQGDTSAKADDVVETLGLSAENKQGLERLSAGQLAAAYSSMRLLTNILYTRLQAYEVAA